MSKVLAMDPNVDLWWVPKVDRELPENEQFRIKHRNLSAREEARITDNQIRSISKGKLSKMEYSVSSADLERCELTIKGWENFKFPENHPAKAGQEVPFSKDNIGLIPPDIRSEYVDFITKRDSKDTETTEEEGKFLGEAKTGQK